MGAWRAVVGEQAVVVKRLAAPQQGDPGELSDPRHFAYWRREADVLSAGLVDATPGLRSGGPAAVDEDDQGITLIQPWVEDAANSGLAIARCLGRFAAAEVEAPWLARNQLRDRISRVERNGAWRTLARTTLADIADRLWSRRNGLLDRLDELPQVPHHGDATPANLRGREGEDLLAIDWGSLGLGPVGADLGYFALSAREQVTPLIEAHLLGLPEQTATRAEVELGARVTAVYTAFNRAEWALARVATGEGPLMAKLRHPSVSPYLRSLQRLVPEIEALL